MPAMQRCRHSSFGGRETTSEPTTSAAPPVGGAGAGVGVGASSATDRHFIRRRRLLRCCRCPAQPRRHLASNCPRQPLGRCRYRAPVDSVRTVGILPWAMSQAAPAVGDSVSETSGGESARTAKPGEGHRTHVPLPSAEDGHYAPVEGGGGGGALGGPERSRQLAVPYV